MVFYCGTKNGEDCGNYNGAKLPSRFKDVITWIKGFNRGAS